MGHSVIGDVTFESAAYCARYVTKKVTGYAADLHYCWQDASGNWRWRRPEYSTMSRGRAIGRGWLETFRGDIWPGDFVVVRGAKMRPPRAYDRFYELIDPADFKRVKRARILGGKGHAEDNTPRRLKDREKVQEARFALLKRELESES